MSALTVTIIFIPSSVERVHLVLPHHTLHHSIMGKGRRNSLRSYSTGLDTLRHHVIQAGSFRKALHKLSRPPHRWIKGALFPASSFFQTSCPHRRHPNVVLIRWKDALCGTCQLPPRSKGNDRFPDSLPQVAHGMMTVSGLLAKRTAATSF